MLAIVLNGFKGIIDMSTAVFTVLVVLVCWNVILTLWLVLVSAVVKNNAHYTVNAIKSFTSFIKETGKWQEYATRNISILCSWKMRIEARHKTEIEEGN